MVQSILGKCRLVPTLVGTLARGVSWRDGDPESWTVRPATHCRFDTFADNGRNHIGIHYYMHLSFGAPDKASFDSVEAVRLDSSASSIEHRN